MSGGHSLNSTEKQELISLFLNKEKVSGKFNEKKVWEAKREYLWSSLTAQFQIPNE